MLTLRPCDYSDAYIVVKVTIENSGTATWADATTQRADERNKQVIFKDSGPFTSCTSEVNDTQVDNADAVIQKFMLPY